MIKKISVLGAMISLLFTVSSCGQSETHRLTLKVDDVLAGPGDSMIAVPVYISHPQDTLAGIEIHVRISENRKVYFATDETGKDGLLLAADTAGSMLSGWEWIGINSMDNNPYDVRVVALADWPNEVITPPAQPAGKERLMTLYLRNDPRLPNEKDPLKLDIMINREKTSFADPHGNTIGLVTTMERVCSQYVGDSCVAWKNMKVGKLDTTVVKYTGGSITFKGE